MVSVLTDHVLEQINCSPPKVLILVVLIPICSIVPDLSSTTTKSPISNGRSRKNNEITEEITQHSLCCQSNCDTANTQAGNKCCNIIAKIIDKKYYA